MSHSPRGSLWNRWDLHFHTPSSFDYADKHITNQQIVDCLINEGLRVVAITDHHLIDVARLRELQALGADKLTVLPGIELRSDQGGKPIHYISIFPEDCDLEHVWATVQGKLELTPTAIRDRGGEDRIYTPIENAASITRQLGGVISIHAGTKSNSLEGILNKEQFQQQIKYDITKQWVDLMEIGQIKDIAIHRTKIFPTTGLDKPLIVCSDNHNVREYITNAPLWFRADPTFRGLLMVLREPQDRVFIGDRPPDTIRVQQNRTKYIRGMSFAKKTDATTPDQWFNGSVQFNTGLVAIVGNKGTGKSALADMLGLLGASKKADSFSFLSKDRFRHPTSGLAKNFEASIEWESGEVLTKSLDDQIKQEEVERLKYLPQDHVETVCNEVAGIGDEGFERELKSVIFSHVPEPQRLGQSTLDDLVRFQTDEKQKRIDSLLKQLREVSRARVALESQADPAAKREIEERINRRESDLALHDELKPTPVANPADTQNIPTPTNDLLDKLQVADSQKASLEQEITAAQAALTVAERRQALAKRLVEKLDNFEKEFAVFKYSLQEDASELGLAEDSLVSLTIDKDSVNGLKNTAAAEIVRVNDLLNATEPPGLRIRKSTLDAEIESLRSQMDAPHQAYQAYLKALNEWTIARSAILGTDKDPESIAGLKAALTSLNGLPDKIKEAQEEQLSLATAIFAEKVAQAEVYRQLYGSVQQFIDTHTLAKDKLKLEFRAELTAQDFAGRLIAILAQNRRGTFMGVDEGRFRAEELVESTLWESEESIRQFLLKVDRSLHFDLRDAKATEVQLKSQLAKGRKAEEVYDLLYGLEYVCPRYILRWEGKDLSMLSPGERGTLLLVFYLLIDKSDLPLVIDQPEGNLDNHTVAKVLVECIKETRRRRQVFIVTHNPNLAVVCDADQIVHASIDKSNGNAITYTSGALENPEMSQFVTDVLEGTRWAFGVRGAKYDVGHKDDEAA